MNLKLPFVISFVLIISFIKSYININAQPVEDSLTTDEPVYHEDIFEKKADFILYVASKITFPLETADSIYKVGIFGRESEINMLAKVLKNREFDLSVQNKPIRIFYFKRTRQIVPVDVLYVNGESKIRISEIDKKLKDYPYFVITENFPFGTSMLNFTVDEKNEIQYEIQPDALEGKGAVVNDTLIKAPNRVISEEEWRELIDAANKILVDEKYKIIQHKRIIESQNREIYSQIRLIQYQQIIITISIIFIVFIIIMSYFLFWVNRQRKSALKQVKQKNQEITDSITYAKLIQEAILPGPDELKKAFSDSFVLYLPKDIVSGDFYWFRQFDDKVILSVVDSTGHGVPGAFMCMMGNELMRFELGSGNVNDPSIALHTIYKRMSESLNQKVTRCNDGMDMAILIFYPQKQELIYAGANRPLVLIRNNEMVVYPALKITEEILIKGKTEALKSTKIKTQPGDCLYLFTDGYQAQFGGDSGKKFMRKRLLNLLLENHELPMAEQEQNLISTFFKWKGKEDQVDDICVLGFKI